MDDYASVRKCQSCAMPMADDSLLGTNADGSLNEDYCKYCYNEGRFLHEATMEEFIEMCAPFGFQAGMTEQQMREFCKAVFPTLKRWRRAQRRGSSPSSRSATDHDRSGYQEERDSPCRQNREGEPGERIP